MEAGVGSTGLLNFFPASIRPIRGSLPYLGIESGPFRYFEHPVNLQREIALEGKYLIQMEEPNLSAIEAMQVYKELSDVEQAFSSLKDVMDMRPVLTRLAYGSRQISSSAFWPFSSTVRWKRN